MSSTCNMSRLIKTAVVMLAITNCGINIGIVSPTLPDIALMTNSTVTQISTTLIWTGVASLLGAVCIGYLFDKLDGMLLLAGCLLGQGVALGFAPWFYNLIAYQALMSVTCIFNFGIMTGCLSLNCFIWKDFPALLGPVIQATDLMHALGVALTPQIVQPFLADETPLNNSSSEVENISAITFLPTASVIEDNMLGSGTILPVQMAYLIVAIFDIFTAIVCMTTCIFSKRHLICGEDKPHSMTAYCIIDESDDDRRFLISEEEPPAAVAPSEVTKGDTTPKRRKSSIRETSHLFPPTHPHGNPINPSTPTIVHTAINKLEPTPLPEETSTRSTMILLVILFFFFVVNGGRDGLLTGLLYTYLKDYLHWDVHTGTLLVTMYHVTRVVVHAVIVLVARFLHPKWLNVANLVVLVLASAIMLGTLYVNKTFSGISVVLMGLATSNIHPTTITLAEESIHVSSKIMGIFVAGIACGQIIFSPIAGLLLEVRGVVSFPSLLLALSLAGVVLFAAWWCVMSSAAKEENSVFVVKSSIVSTPTGTGSLNDSMRSRPSHRSCALAESGQQ